MRTTMLRRAIGASLVALSAACSSGDDGGTPKGPTGPTGTISLQVTPASATVTQGGQTQVTGTLTRGGGFTGSVTFTVEGQPAGVSASLGSPQTSGTVTTVVATVPVGPGTTPGQYPITVRGKATGLTDAVATFQLTVTEAPDYALAVTPAAVTLNQGESRDDIAVAIARTNFAGPVTLGLGGAVPAGVTASFAPAAPTGATSTMTLSVDAAAPVGNYDLQITGTAEPGGRSVPFALTILPAPDLTLALEPAGAVTVQQGEADASKTVVITRTNFTGAVTLTVEGLPDGVTASFTENPAAGTASAMTLTASSTAVVGGPATVTVRGTGPAAAGAFDALQAEATFELIVVEAPPPPPPPPNMSLDLAGCTPLDQSLVLFVKDGSNDWVMVPGTNHVYDFQIDQPVAGLALVTRFSSSGRSVITVQYKTRDEWLAAQPHWACPPIGAMRGVTATLAGVGVDDDTYSTLGGWTNYGVGPGLIFLGPLEGTYDFVGYKHTHGGPGLSARMRFIRDVAPTVTDLGVIDFSASPAFTPSAATMTLTGLMGQTYIHDMQYYTRASCDMAVLYDGTALETAASFTAYGATGPRPPTDFHVLNISTSFTSPIRTVSESFHTLSNRTVAFGPILAVPTVSSLGGPYKRLRAAFQLPPEFQTSVSFGYFAVGSPQRTVNIEASYAFLGGAGAHVLEMPNFAGVAGWDDADAPGPARTGNWSLVASGATHGGAICVEGSRRITSTRLGPF